MLLPGQVRLGTCSPATRATTPETLRLLERMARCAAALRIDLLLFPEAFLGGYPRGSHFGCVVGHRSTEGRDEYLRYFRAAVDLGDTVGDGAGAGDAWVRCELPRDPVGRQHLQEQTQQTQQQQQQQQQHGGGGGGGGGDDDDDNRSVLRHGSISTTSRGDGTREELERIARGTGVFLVVGCIERAGGSLYCAVVYVCPKLGIIGKRRKVLPVSRTDVSTQERPGV